MTNKLYEEIERLRAERAEHIEIIRRVGRKLKAYIGVCDGDKELTDTIIPMVEEFMQTEEGKI